MACSTGKCKYGSFVTSAHPCKVSGKLHLECKHPETMQQEYNRLLEDICGLFAMDYTLDKPIRFRLTPHSNEIIITELIAGVDVEQYYGEAKHTVMQTLRFLKSNKNDNN